MRASGWYWLVLQVTAVAAGVYGGVLLFRVVTR